MAFLCNRDALLAREELRMEWAWPLDPSTSPGARGGPCSPLSLRVQGQCQLRQQESSQKMLLPEWPTQLEHAGHLGVGGLAGEGGALQREGGGESGDGRKEARDQGSEVSAWSYPHVR